MGMQRKYLDVVRAMPQGERAQVMRVARTRTLSELAVHDQADVVVALLREDLLVPAVRLVGRPISLYPPSAMLGPPLPAPEPRLDLDDRRVVRVKRNPRLPTTDAFARFCLLKPGMTIRQFLARGGRRRDIRLALRREWIVLSDGR